MGIEGDLQINELETIDELSFNDLTTIFDGSASGSGNREVKYEKYEKILIPNHDEYGDNTLGLVGNYFVDTIIYGTAQKARITAYDLIKSIHGGDGSKITYGIKKNADEEWTESVNPFDAYVEFTCSDSIGGANILNLRVKDNTDTLIRIESVVVLLDPNGLCA